MTQMPATLGTQGPAIGAHWCSLIECSNLIGRVPTTRTAPLSFAANISRGPEFRLDLLGQLSFAIFSTVKEFPANSRKCRKEGVWRELEMEVFIRKRGFELKLSSCILL